MSFRQIKRLCSVLTLFLLPLAGCNQGSSPPPPLAVEQIPAEMQKAFSKSAPEIKEAVAQMTAALQSKDYPVAYQGAQFLCSLPSVTPAQRMVASRAALTLNGLLQTAQAQGDQKAAETLRLRQMNR